MAEAIHTQNPPPRRGVPDRRQKPTPMISRYTFFGRRRVNRRVSDPRVAYYVDWIEGPYLLTLVGVLVLILVDTVSTLYIISRGGGEANPIMRWMLNLGPLWFVLVKIGSALVAFLLLAVHRFFRVARTLTTLVLAAYGALVLYHLILLIRIHS